MASQFDLAPRLAALQRRGLIVSSTYHGHPAQWLRSSLEGVDVAVVNVKGTKHDDTVCMVRLATLEALLAAAAAKEASP